MHTLSDPLYCEKAARDPTTVLREPEVSSAPAWNPTSVLQFARVIFRPAEGPMHTEASTRLAYCPARNPTKQLSLTRVANCPVAAPRKVEPLAIALAPLMDPKKTLLDPFLTDVPAWSPTAALFLPSTNETCPSCANLSPRPPRDWNPLVAMPSMRSGDTFFFI